MKKNIFYLCLHLLTSCFIPLQLLAESSTEYIEYTPEKLPSGKVTGQIYDKQSKKPMQYATISILSSENKQIVGGVMSDDKGKFEIDHIKPGKYFLEASFIGYNPSFIEDIQITRSNPTVNIGKIILQTNDIILDGVLVSADNRSVEYQIDKKVINVGEELTAAGMTAVEVLENVPSIRVDIDGEVSLRGSTGFTVLVDGKPSILDASDVLRQMPASTIHSIEVITNPSAKYQPDGTAGLLNIITKKNRMQGLQGLVNLKGGSFGKYGGDLLLNYKSSNINFYVGGQYDNSPRPSESYSEQVNFYGDSTITRSARGEGSRDRKSYSLRGGIDWDLGAKDNFTIEARVGKFKMNRHSELNYLTNNNFNSDRLKQFNENNNDRTMNYLSISSNYLHKFSGEGHELAFQANLSKRDGDETSINQLANAQNILTQGTMTTETGPMQSWDFKLDYTQSFSKALQLETGAQMRINQSEDITSMSSYDPATQSYVSQALFDNNSTYDRDIYAVYTILKGEHNHLGYQLGLRGEYTYRDIYSETHQENFTIDRFDLFPTLHLSYQLPQKQQIMTSYSRRINRPRGFYFEPFLTWSDMFNVRQGNPALLPEYTDATELGYLKSWETSQFSLEGFYRVKNNRIERIKSVYSEQVLLTTYENIGKDYSLGIEAMYNTSLYKWWELSLMGDMYNFQIQGELDGQSFDRSSFNWGTRINNTFKVKRNLRLQLDANYNSPSISSQGKQAAYYSANVGARTSFFEGKLSLTAQVRDIFSTFKHESTTTGSGFYNFNTYTPQSPSLSFTLSYSINNYKEKRKARDSTTENMEEEF